MTGCLKNRDNSTYGELNEAADAVLAYLLNLGLVKGARVVLIADNTFFWVAAYLGTLRAGMVCVPLPVNTSLDDLAYILHITEARMVFADARFAVKARVQLQDCRVVTSLDALPLPNALSPKPAPVRPDDLAALMFTSGSTGKPRGVMVRL